MRRFAAFASVLALTGVVASTSYATESTIDPGVGIGKVKLGMTRSQVERVLGHDAIVNGRWGGLVELAWNFASWTVAFERDGRTLHAVQVGTVVPNQRTPSGIGVGTLWRPLVRAYPHGVCGFGNSLDLPSSGTSFGKMGVFLEYLVPHRGGTQTIYVLKEVFAEKLQKVVNYRVFEVHVRRPYAPLEEFSPNSPHRCHAGWESTNVPQEG